MSWAVDVVEAGLGEQNPSGLAIVAGRDSLAVLCRIIIAVGRVVGEDVIIRGRRLGPIGCCVLRADGDAVGVLDACSRHRAAHVELVHIPVVVLLLAIGVVGDISAIGAQDHW